METRIKISPTGPEFSRMVAGVWKWGEWGHQLNTNQVLDLIHAALDLGITTFDHADIYGGYSDEGLFGSALSQEPALRQKIELVTKCAIRMVSDRRPDNRLKSYDTSAQYIRNSVENSLKELSVEHIDLLLIHRPDPLMDPQEISGVVEALKQEGKIGHFGVSNFTPSQFELLASKNELCTNQVEISLVNPAAMFDGTLDQCLTRNIRPMAWSPLGSGLLFADPPDPSSARIREVTGQLAEQYGIAVDQLLLAWLLKHPGGILPVLGTAKPERLASAMEALNIELDRQDWFALLESSTGSEVP